MDTFVAIIFYLPGVLFTLLCIVGLLLPYIMGPEKYKAFKEKMDREEEERRRIKKLKKEAEWRDICYWNYKMFRYDPRK